MLSTSLEERRLQHREELEAALTTKIVELLKGRGFLQRVLEEGRVLYER